MHLFRDGWLPSTTISHRTSVASVLHHWNYDPAADPHIKLIIGAFRLERPIQRRIMPKWDLHLVLSALMSPPFASEVDDRGRISDDVIDLRWRTMKTVFLLAMASAWRRSYLHALSVASGRCVFGRGNTQRQKVVAIFLAKSQLPSLPNGSQSHVSLILTRMNQREIECYVWSDNSSYQAISKGYRNNPGGGGGGGVSTALHTLELSHKGHHEKSYQ